MTKNLSSILSEDTYKIIEDIVLEIGRRLSNADEVSMLANSEESFFALNGQKIKYWNELSLGIGYPGICMLLAELSEVYPEEEWDIIAHHYMVKIQQAINEDGLKSQSLFGGAAGLGMCALTLSKGGKRYSNFINQINQLLQAQLEKNFHLSSYKTGTSTHEYDVIQGLSGIGRYMLFLKEDPNSLKILKEILKYMNKLCNNINVEGHDVPGWYTPPAYFIDEKQLEQYPNGNFNCGLSHGIAGPLALLSISLLNNVEVEGQREAIFKILTWYEKVMLRDNFGPYWGVHVSLEDELKGENTTLYTRAAWCYGTPGVARAIWLAGCALKEEKYKELSCEAFHSIFKRTEKSWNIASPIFCHGYAGLLHITKLMYEDTKDLRFIEYIDKLLNNILKQYDANSPFCFCDLIHEEATVKEFNNPGLLEGSAGIALVLLSLIKPTRTQWDSVFLIK